MTRQALVHCRILQGDALLENHAVVIDGGVIGGRNWSQQQQGYVGLREALGHRTE